MFKSIKTYANLLSIIKTVIFSLFIVAVIGIAERYSNLSFYSLFSTGIHRDYDFIRLFTSVPSGVEAGYAHRILFGYSMVLGAILSFCFLKQYPIFNKAFSNVIIFIFLISVYFSRSRGHGLV